MQHQHLSVNFRTCSNANDRDLKAGSHFSAQISRYLLKNKCKTASLFNQMRIFNQFSGFLVIFSPYHISPEFMDRLRSKSKMSHYRDTRTKDTGNRFNYFTSSFQFNTMGTGFFHYPDR